MPTNFPKNIDSAMENAGMSMRQKYFSTVGRIGRFDYWFRSQLIGFITCLLFLFEIAVAAITHSVGIDAGGNIIAHGLFGYTLMAAAIIQMLMTWWAEYCAAALRAHDLSYPSVAGFLIYAPWIGLLAFLLLCILRGKRGSNSFGSDPTKNSWQPSLFRIVLAILITIGCNLSLLILIELGKRFSHSGTAS